MEAYGKDFQDADGNWIVQESGSGCSGFLVSLRTKVCSTKLTRYLEEDVRRVFSPGDAASHKRGYMYAMAGDPAEAP